MAAGALAAVRQQVPATIHDVTVAQATVAARGNNINTVDDIASAGIFDDRLYVQGTKVGQFTVMVDLSSGATPAEQRACRHKPWTSSRSSSNWPSNSKSIKPSRKGR